MKLIHEHAKEWYVDTDKIVVQGLSLIHIYELDFDDKQEYEFATRGLIDAPETLELKDENGTILWS